jgi:hypothetical protein
LKVAIKCVPASGLAVASALVIALSGCGTNAGVLHTTSIERAISSSILTQHHLYAHVSCPSQVRRSAGVRFVCDAQLDVGTYPVAVTELNDRGRVRYENRSRLTVLDIARVRAAIARSIASQRHHHATVTCPREVLQQAGLSFSCTVIVAGHHYSFSVRELDSYGHVRYVGHP